MSKPYLFTFWEPVNGTPAYIEIALELMERHLSDSFYHVHLNLQTAQKWSNRVDEFLQASDPFALGKSISFEGRRIAVFSDMLRIELLKNYGGLWIDADTLVMPEAANIADIVDNYDFFCSESERLTLANGVMGGKAGSAFLGAMYESMLNRLENNSFPAKLHWGELGFRLIEKVYLARPCDNLCIAPFGTLIQNTGDNCGGIYSSQSNYSDMVAPQALALSMSNSSTPEHVRSKSKTELLVEDTVFSLFHQRSSSIDNSKTKSTSLPLFYNRSDYLRSTLLKRQEHIESISMLKQKLNRRNSQLAKSIQQRDQFAAKLKIANERIVRLKERHEH